MSPDQIALVEKSFKEIVPMKDLAADMFYTRLFELDPDLEPLFTTDRHQQGQRLMSTLATVIGGLRNWNGIEPVIRELGRRHVAYGVRSDHYETFGDALMWALEQALGGGFTEEVKAAWATIYRAITGTMIDAARTQAA